MFYFIYKSQNNSHFTSYDIFHCSHWSKGDQISSECGLSVEVKTGKNYDIDYYCIEVKELINEVRVAIQHVDVRIVDDHVDEFNYPLNERNRYDDSVVPKNVQLC